MAAGSAALSAYLYPLVRDKPTSKNEGEGQKRERGGVRHRPRGDVQVESQSEMFLPSSSNSDVIDLERIDSAVVGALFGGGGAINTHTHAHSSITI